jgi:hypothetical protein
LEAPPGSDVVVTVKPEAMVSEITTEDVCSGAEESVTVTVTLNVPALVGVPPTTPAGFILMPGGKPVADQV